MDALNQKIFASIDDKMAEARQKLDWEAQHACALDPETAKAIRDSRIAAEACRLNITEYKLKAFVTSAAMAGAAGALYALNYSTVVPKKFDFNTSILILVFVVLGGIGNLRGSMIAAALLTVLPELLRQFQDYRMLVYAIVLILVMLVTNNEEAKALAGRIGDRFRRKSPVPKKE